MNDGTNSRPGDMRFDDDGEILVFDGENWALYRRIPMPGTRTVFRRPVAEPIDQPEAGADE